MQDVPGDHLHHQVQKVCRTYLETTCSTRYRSKPGGDHLGDTACSRTPRQLCGAGCSVTEGKEECQDKQVDSVLEVPEEHCDLAPEKVCRQVSIGGSGPC